MAGWDWSGLAIELSELSPLLTEAGLDIEILGFQQAEIDSLVGRICHGAEQRYELTPFQLTELHTLPLAREFLDGITDWRGSSQGLAALRDFDPVYVGLGSTCEILAESISLPMYPQ
jgi:hypothetical protein